MQLEQQTYLVGGAIRDRLLGRPVQDKDWVVVGARPEDMVAAGYRQVGKDFPVFLHPVTGDEHALARVERKIGPGYRGFCIIADGNVTLEDDLARRDLTINAMAQDHEGQLIDLAGGVKDLCDGVLRHVSEAFAEDPVRILRVARFMAQLERFVVAEETMGLMCRMVEAGEVDALTSERVWKETARALMTDRPSLYFETLRACGALARIFPEIDALFGVPQPPQHHPEVDSGVHTLMCVDRAAEHGYPLEVRYAALVHDLGKGTTPQAEWPRHLAHEARGVPLVERMSERLRAPRALKDLGMRVSKEHLRVHRCQEMTAKKIHDLVHKLNGLKVDPAFVWALDACECDAQGRAGLENQPYPQKDFLLQMASAARAVPTGPLQAKGLTGEKFGAALRQMQIGAIARAKKAWLETDCAEISPGHT